MQRGSSQATNIILKSDNLEIVKILRKTKSEMFENLKVGDTIILSIEVKCAGSNKGTYASYIKAENLGTGECNYKSFNQINGILSCFEFKN